MIAPDEILLQWALEDPTGGIAIVCGLLAAPSSSSMTTAAVAPEVEKQTQPCTALSSRCPPLSLVTKKGRQFSSRLPRDANGNKIPLHGC